MKQFNTKKQILATMRAIQLIKATTEIKFTFCLKWIAIVEMNTIEQIWA